MSTDPPNKTPAPLPAELAECRSIVFDVDGTLVLSEPIIQRTIFEVLGGFLTPEAKADFELHRVNIAKECFGNSEDIFCIKLLEYLSARRLLLDRYLGMDSKEFALEFTEARIHRYLVFAEQGSIRPMPGVVPFVKAAFQRFGALALNTASPAKLSAPMLQIVFKGLLDIEDIFPHRLRTYIHDLPHGFGKPQPDGYLRAARLLGIAPWDLAAVVDRGNDCISALRAGYRRVVVVPEDNDRAPLEAASGKHSLVEFFAGYPSSEAEELKKKVLIVNSLEDLVGAPI
jgi:beta-phosphoglucomutase-like phosphatase (HAD superfamily)